MYLAIDYGTRHVGLAATDPDGKITYRYATLDQQKVKVIEEILAVVAKERITTLVIGLPKALGGNETEQTKITQKFIDTLSNRLQGTIKIETVSETLSSVEAKRNIQAEGVDASLEHAEAARLMLEEYLNISAPLR